MSVKFGGPRMGKRKQRRITNPYVLGDDLLEETGVEDVDDFLYALVNILQLSMGEFLRAIFVIGSYAHGGYRPDSDIDMCFLWREGIDFTPCHQKGWSIISHFVRPGRHRIDPMWNDLETPFYDRSNLGHPDRMPCGPIMRLAVKERSLLLWGEDGGLIGLERGRPSRCRPACRAAGRSLDGSDGHHADSRVSPETLGHPGLAGAERGAGRDRPAHGPVREGAGLGPRAHFRSGRAGARGPAAAEQRVPARGPRRLHGGFFFSARSHAWSDVGPFRIGWVGAGRGVVFDFSRDYRRAPRLRRFSKAISGHEAALPDPYGMPAEELAELLNHYRQQHLAG